MTLSKKFQIIPANTSEGILITAYNVIENDVHTMRIIREAEFSGHWVARRVGTLEFVDRDKYRHDLFERLEIQSKKG